MKRAKSGDTHYPAATLVKPYADLAAPAAAGRAPSPPSEEGDKEETAKKAEPGSGVRAEQGFMEGVVANLVDAGFAQCFARVLPQRHIAAEN